MLLRKLEDGSVSFNPIWAVALTSDGERVISGAYAGLQVWDLENGEFLATLPAGLGATYSVVVIPDRQQAISASGNLKVWDLQRVRRWVTQESSGGAANKVAVTPDGRQAVSSGFDGTFKVWDLEAGRIERTFDVDDKVFAAALTQDGKHAIWSGDDMLNASDLGTGRVQMGVQIHDSQICEVAVTPDGRRVISASADHLVAWNFTAGGLTARLLRRATWAEKVNAAALTPDGKRADLGGYWTGRSRSGI